MLSHFHLETATRRWSTLSLQLLKLFIGLHLLQMQMCFTAGEKTDPDLLME